MSIARGTSLAVACTALAVGLAPDAQSQISVTKCKTADLQFEYTAGGATYSVAVRKLQAHNTATCRIARRIARVVAKDLLHNRAVPDTVRDYAVTIDEPCPGCAPVWNVKAKKSRVNRITFKVAGGA